MTCALLAAASSLPAQEPPAWADSFVVITPGARYTKGGFWQILLGAHYRDLWATPVRVPLLDLRGFAGGLSPLAAHVGSQTRSLRLQGADGRQYQFRAVDKDPTARLTPELQRSVAAKVLQDGVSASHPAGALVASRLLDAAGVLHVEQTLVVMPDDPALGEFRADFAGAFGMVEERPDEGADESAAFAGARRVISPTRLFERLDAAPADRVDPAAFLTARLMDILMGDRDRHRDQFRWASFGDTVPRIWYPISRDHDEAFVRLDGFILDLARLYYPPLVEFGPTYGKHDRLNWHAREVDRRFLVELDRAAWDSVAASLAARLTDSVIDAAVGRLPAEMAGVGGAWLGRTLKARRDRLPAEAASYYRFLAREVEVRATGAPEIAELHRLDGRYLDLAIRPRGAAQPWFRRRFDGRDTREIRLKMWGGDDSVVVRGAGDPPIRLRLVGGPGDDVVVDSSRAGRLRVYDDAGRNAVVSARPVPVNTTPYQEWVGSDLDRYPPRDWGTWWRPIPWLTASSDLGLFLGAGFLRTEYGFRKAPYASNLRVRAGYATRAATFRADLDGEARPENAPYSWRVYALASGLEILRYFGLGNDTDGRGASFHKVRQQHYRLEPSLVVRVRKDVKLFAGPIAQWSHTAGNAGRFIATIQDTLYGAGNFGQLGGRVGFEVDTRDYPLNPSRGLHLRGEGHLYPALWNVRTPFGSLGGRASATFSVPRGPRPTLALGVGGQKLWGTFPFQESAFLGGPETLRGYFQQRFAGDASLFGEAELRLTVGTSYWALPATWGVFGHLDGGRVYFRGDSPGGWHTGIGGGIWLAFLGRGNTAALGVTGSGERTSVYGGVGFGF